MKNAKNLNKNICPHSLGGAAAEKNSYPRARAPFPP